MITTCWLQYYCFWLTIVGRQIPFLVKSDVHFICYLDVRFRFTNVSCSIIAHFLVLSDVRIVLRKIWRSFYVVFGRPISLQEHPLEYDCIVLSFQKSDFVLIRIQLPFNLISERPIPFHGCTRDAKFALLPPFQYGCRPTAFSLPTRKFGQWGCPFPIAYNDLLWSLHDLKRA